MKLVLDTNAYCLCDTAHEGALSALEEARHVFLPVIVFGELYYGFKHGARLQDNLKRLERFIEEFDVQVIPMDLSVARHFGDIYSSLRRKGRPIPTNDIWIAACCSAVGGTLLTADRHFSGVEQIELRLIEEG
jgi:predicted nucleic acid-binding protein